MNIWEEIEQERTNQDAKWGGPSHDDEHTLHDWIAYIVRHMGKAMYAEGQPAACLPRARRQMIRVAALAVATIAWIDRLGFRHGEPHDFDGSEYDCAKCGEGRMYYLHES